MKIISFDIGINNLSYCIFDIISEDSNNNTPETNDNTPDATPIEKQIVIILRALLNKNSHILLMDEPTSAVDIEHKKIIMNLIKKIKTKTIIMITHDENVMNDVDKVVYIG